VSAAKPHAARKRAKRTVENREFDAFIRRVLRAYARRVAAGDVEALRSLAGLASEVDAATRLAVAGLRQPAYGYSWEEIADRLGVTRQAAHARYGDKPARAGALDRRLVRAGQLVTVPLLVEVFADHCPGIPAPLVCPGCGFTYTDKAAECPTLATVRPLLHRRRAEDTNAVGRLTPDQYEYLTGKRTIRNPGRTRMPVPTPRQPEQGPPSLFPISAHPVGGERR